MADRDAIKSDSLCIRVAIDRKGNTSTTTVQSSNLDVPIGALVRIRVNVEVNGVPAEVVNSQWTLQGKQITAATQTLERGVAIVINGPREMVGNPDYVDTAWIVTGPQGITTEGKYLYEGGEYPFTSSGTATVFAPTVNITQEAHVNDGGSWDNDKVLILFLSGSAKMDIPQMLANGTGGFLQIIKGQRYRGEQDGQPTQTMGSLTPYLDADGEELFYAHQPLVVGSNELETNDEPSQKIEQHDEKFPNMTFKWYGIGTNNWGDGAQKENFDTYIAFKAPKTKGVIESYIVTSHKVNWWWRAMLKYVNEEEGWDLKGYGSDCGEWEDLGGWSITAWDWTNNSKVLKNWRNP